MRATLTLDPAFVIAPVNPRTFGSFVEHMGRGIYTGIYEPGHPRADEAGLRTDVLDLVRELGVTTVRYPGGNFVSSFVWEDSIGPVAERPRRADLAWHAIETNEFGLHEFLQWTQVAGVEPMMALNLGTRGINAAVDLLQYCTMPQGTVALADQRASNGHPEPFAIRMWCLGNELDGPWQVGHKTAHEYGRLAAETARAMRLVDPGLELVVCGSSGSGMPTFGAWEAEVLEQTYDVVDYISCHAYYEERDGDLASFLASAVDMDHFIDSVVATADHVGARLRNRKRIDVSFDEWNVWYLSRHQSAPQPVGWSVAPRLIEDEYTVADAVVVGGLLISLLRHSDRVTAASLAQLVNVIAPIRTEPGGPAWRQATFHPFALTARHARGEVLQAALDAEAVHTAQYGSVPGVDAVATLEGDQLAVFLVNRSVDDTALVEADLRGVRAQAVVETHCLACADPYLVNTVEHPDRVVPRPLAEPPRLDGGRLTAALPPVSWTLLRVHCG